VLCARVIGDRTRPPALRAAAAAAAVPLGMGCYLSFSRGALAALAAGLLTLVVLAPTFGQLRAALLVAVAGAAGAIAAAASPAVRALDGSAATREREGAIVLAVALVLMALAAVAAVVEQVRLGRRPPARRDGPPERPHADAAPGPDRPHADAAPPPERPHSDAAPRLDRPLPLPRWAGWAALAAIVALLVVPIAAAGGKQQAPPATGATNQRFASLGSNRYSYWRIAIDTGLDHPLAGVGASGFRVAWLEHRDVDENVRDAHSLELETFAELGLVGVALLAALLGAVALSARAAHRVDPALAAGPAAALTAWAFHSAIDWDWEMPALTLVAVVLAGALLAVRAEGRG
jgi:O-Antigen ligase